MAGEDIWTPEGWEKLDADGVYVNDNQLVVFGQPDENSGHNCDAMGCAMGCSSIDHVLVRCLIPDYQAVQIQPDRAPADLIYVPFHNCGWKDAEDGCCGHPDNATPECHQHVCPIRTLKAV